MSSQWKTAQETAFNEANKLLTSSKILVHYDPHKPLVLSCDVSPYGVGAVLSHKLDDGYEHPVAFASRTLSPAEKQYFQLDKEGLAIIFRVQRFYHYLLGREFTILLYLTTNPYSTCLADQVIDKLHAVHTGISIMKSLAHSYVSVVAWHG